MTKTEDKLNPTVYEYWFNKLIENENRCIPTLANAYCALLGIEMPADNSKRDTLIKRMGAIYRDSRQDPFEVLIGINDMRFKSIEGNPLNYLTVMLRKRRGE